MPTYSKSAIKALIEDGQLAGALDILKKLARENEEQQLESDAVQLSARQTNLLEAKNKGLISHEAIQLDTNNLIEAILHLINRFPDALFAPPANTSRILLPLKPDCFGREELLEKLVIHLCSGKRKPICLLGGPGMGKSNLALNALHDPKVADRFGNWRLFVRGDGALSRKQLVDEIAGNLGMATGQNLEEAVLHRLSEQACLLVLDNLERPWQADAEEIEALLSRLFALPELSCVATVRGNEKPAHIPWQSFPTLKKLPAGAARELFLSIAGEEFEKDPLLGKLIREMDGLPLAVELLANQAQGHPNLKWLYEQWKKQPLQVLRHGSGSSPKDSLGMSLQLSVTSSRMTPAARRLLALLGLLPDGIAEADLSTLLPPEEAVDAASVLCKMALAFFENDRLQTLAPVRHYLSREFLPDKADAKKAELFYCQLGETLGWKSWKRNGAVIQEHLRAESGNLAAMTRYALSGENRKQGIASAIGLSEWYRFSGWGDVELLQQALVAAAGDELSRANVLLALGKLYFILSKLEEAQKALLEALTIFQGLNDSAGQADTLQWLGDVAHRRSEDEAARSNYEAAISLFEKAGDRTGQANCIQWLGDIDLHQSRHDAAQKRYETALAIYEESDELLGQANCHQSLGDLALERSQLEIARLHYSMAQPLYANVGAVLGEANSIKSMGDIALAKSNHDEAIRHFDEALRLFEITGDLHSQAITIKSLGDVALERSEFQAAHEKYEQALGYFEKGGSIWGQAICINGFADVALQKGQPDDAQKLYRRAISFFKKVDSKFGEARCKLGLGDVALANQQPEAARKHWLEASELFNSIADPYFIAQAHTRLGRQAEGVERRQHVQIALSSLLSIGFTDLIEKLKTEFPDLFENGEGLK